MAADLSQQVALECLARLRSGTLVIHRKSLGGLARTMANGRRIDRERQRRTRTGSEAQYCLDNADHVHPWMSADVQLEEGELDRFYRRVLDSLKPRARLTFIMVRELGLSYDEVAMQLCITKSAVQWHVTDVQSRFRIELNKIGVQVPKAARSAALPRASRVGAKDKAAPALRLIRGDAPPTPKRSVADRKGVA